MGSNSKKRTTVAKLNREGKLREKRVEKEARKAARRLSAADDAVQPSSRLEEHRTAPSGFDGAGHGGVEPESLAAAGDAGRGT